MENTGNINPTDIKIQGLLNSYLKARSANGEPEKTQIHLDEDSLTAFVEGNLSRRESQPIVRHLVDCSFCRHITTELVRLDLAFAGQTETAAVSAVNQPTKVSEVLGGILSRIFGSNDGAVFAHHEEDSEQKTEIAESEEK